MFFNLIKDKCAQCGMALEKEKAVIESGKSFCSPEHAAAYAQAAVRDELSGDGRKNAHKGGCCH